MLVQASPPISPRTPFDSAYIELLENTNTQLSLWLNPYAVMVGVLAVLFTLLTIAAAFVLYRQGRDHDSRIEKFLQGAQDVLKQHIATWQTQSEMEIERFQTEIGRLQEQLAKATEVTAATETQKKLLEEQQAAIEDHIDRLRDNVKLFSVRTKAADYVGGAIANVPMEGVYYKANLKNAYRSKRVPVTCARCGKTYEIDPIARALSGGLTSCPYCGEVKSP